MPSSCLQLSPLKVCGVHGNCVQVDTINNTAESFFCKCDNGWEQSLEVNFFVEKDSLKLSVCNFNPQVISSIYIAVTVLAVINSLLQLLVIDSKKRLKRQLPFLTFSLMIFGVSIYRIQNPRTALLTVDPAFSIIVSIATSLPQVQSYILMTKYLRYMKGKVACMDDVDSSNFISQSRFAEIAEKVYLTVTVLSVVALQWLWLLTVIDIDKRSALIGVRVMLGVNVLRLIYQIAFISITLTALIRDMQELLKVGQDHSNSSFIKVSSTNILEFIKRKIPSTESMRRRFVIVSLLDLQIFFWGIPFDIWILSWTYLLPFLLLLTYLYSLTVITSKVVSEYRSITVTSTDLGSSLAHMQKDDSTA